MTAKIKLNAASGGGSASIQAPSSSSNNRVFTLPDIADATMATVNGITEFDQWYLSADNSSNGDITSNLSRNSFSGSACPLGTGMSQSSGIFSFPSTGKYLVICKAAVITDDSDNVYVETRVTLNNGTSYAAVTIAGDGNNGSGLREGQGTSFYFLDVTDISQVKVKFSIISIIGSSFVKGDNSQLSTSFTFIRIADT